jgi:hypothetical protein
MGVPDAFSPPYLRFERMDGKKSAYNPYNPYKTYKPYKLYKTYKTRQSPLPNP